MENSVRDQLTLLEHWVKDELETQKKLLSVSVAFVATLPEITQAIANQDREELKNFILPYMERIRMTSTNSSIYFHFHLQSLVSFLRTWDINKWGDDLSSYRNMVIRANRELSSFTGFEIGHGGPVMRSISPIFFNGKHLGSVEAAADISEILQKISLVQNYGMAIVLNRDFCSLLGSSQTVRVVDQGAILKSYGDTDNNLASTILKENTAEGRTGDIFFVVFPSRIFRDTPSVSLFYLIMAVI
ncbi:MAG: cache domain-containing protein [Pseudomonadota bacterium]